ncbi:MAG: amidase family protein, partial [Candidatus Latescibacteria bacterium]|nr:amidase family protein [Candidatus Latescibacterota bacterium]
MTPDGQEPSLIYRTATDLAGAIRRREVTAVEVVEAHLARIEATNGTLNAVVTLCAEQALDRARRADAALQTGELWGPLHGVPITVKDHYATAGLRTTSGHTPFADNVPDEDATVVARLLAAGAILLGKTNMPPLGLNYQCDNELFGRTNNPWDLGRTPGGSSGGSAAAVAAGMVPLELGGDFAGSIRVPAHYCGVFSMKPTEFLVP